jgi:hypothetical protein
MENRVINRDSVRRKEPSQVSTERVCLFGLAGLAVISEALYVALARFNAIDGLWPVASFVGLMLALFIAYGLAFRFLKKIRGRMKAAIVVVVFTGALFRITLIPAGLPAKLDTVKLLRLASDDLHGGAVTFDRYLLYDDDVWRYLWDAHLWANSVNPYKLAPADPRLDYISGPASPIIWSDIRDNINHAQIPTIYPPLAQLVFRLAHALAPGSVITLKTVLVVFDMFTVFLVYLLLRVSRTHPAWLLVYAWNPLLIKVVAGSGHVDVLVGTLLALTAYLLLRRAHLLAAVALGGASLVKLAPLVLLPFLAKRIGWKKSLVAFVVVVSAYLPFVGSEWSVLAGLARFAREWQFNSALFVTIQSLARPFAKDPAIVARAVGVIVFLAVGTWLWRRDDGRCATFPHFGTWILAALILVSPTVMPWYLVWILPIAATSQASTLFWFTGLVCLSFFIMVDGTQRMSVLTLEYGMFLAVVLWPPVAATAAARICCSRKTTVTGRRR